MIATNASCRFQDIAAVLTSLDPATRDELLACFDPDERLQLAAILNGTDRPDGQQTRALVGELLRSLRCISQPKVNSDSEGIDLEEWAGQVTWEELGANGSIDDHALPVDPIEQALANIPISGLLKLLEPQHPQLVAATLKLLPPRQRQLVLQRIPHALQVEIAQRMEHCDNPHPDIVVELRCELMNHFTTVEVNTHRTTIPLHGSDARRGE